MMVNSLPSAVTQTIFLLGDTNGCRDVFVRDRLRGTNILVSVNSNGIAPGNGPSAEPAINGNGRYVAFTSSATNLVAGDDNRSQDVFVRDLQAATTVLVSANTGGTETGQWRFLLAFDQRRRQMGFVSQQSQESRQRCIYRNRKSLSS